MKNNSLAENKGQLLREIGFEFNQETHDLAVERQIFHRYIEQLHAWKQKYGHLNATWAQDRSLYSYC